LKLSGDERKEVHFVLKSEYTINIDSQCNRTGISHGQMNAVDIFLGATKERSPAIDSATFQRFSNALTDKLHSVDVVWYCGLA
jgi:hypothetical protein